MRVIHHISLAALVVLVGCSRSSPPGASAQSVSNEPESAQAAPSTVAQPPAGEGSVFTFTAMPPRTSFTLMKREITLSKQQPSDSFVGARLIEVAAKRGVLAISSELADIVYMIRHV